MCHETTSSGICRANVLKQLSRLYVPSVRVSGGYLCTYPRASKREEVGDPSCAAFTLACESPTATVRAGVAYHRGLHVLIIGGNRFVGRSLALQLVFRRHRVTVLNRGTLPTIAGVELLCADRSSDAFDRAVAARAFDAVVDFAGFTGADARRAIRT